MVLLDVRLQLVPEKLGLHTNSLFSNVPAGVIVILIVSLFVPVSKSNQDNQNRKLPVKEKLLRMDPIGTTIFLGAVCCLLLSLVWGGQTYPWDDSRIIGLFVGFGLLTICFCYWLWRQGEVALIPLRILRKRSIAMGAVTLFAIGLAMNIVRTCHLPALGQRPIASLRS
jgi:hypothetical protein